MKVYVHGGVSGVAKEITTSLAPAVSAGMQCSGALDAIESAVTRLEDEPALNAGYGSALNSGGRLEMDAGIACLSSARSGQGSLVVGAVAGVQVRNPIRLARLVAEDTPHILMVGDGANDLGAGAGLEPMTESSPQQHDRWSEAASRDALDPERFGRPDHVDTVGAVALDDDGCLAAASSTGGVFGQLPGRVGDSPLFGAGFYVSAEVAVVGTGVGEMFMETLACRTVAEVVGSGVPVDQACWRITGELGAGGTAAGLLAIDHEGNVGAAFSGGAWRVEGPDGPIEPQRVV